MVIKQEARARHDDLAAKARIERGGASHPITLGVRRGEVRGVPVLLPGEPVAIGLGRRAGCRDHRGSIEADPSCQVSRVFLGHQSPGHTREVRIAKPASPIGEGQLHCLGDDMGQFGGTVAHSGEVKAFQNVENLHDMDSARAGRREAHDFVTSIGAPNRFARHHFVAGEVGGRDHAAVGLHPLGRSVGEVAAVKPSHAARGHLPVRPSKVALAQAIARRRNRRQTLQKDGFALGE